MSKKMRARLLLSAALSLSAIGLLIAVYILSADSEGRFFAFKISFIYALLISMVLFWLITTVSKKLFLFIFDISRKYENIEKLLVDLRNGTKTFYKEKRKYRRVKTRGQVLTKIIQKERDKLIKVFNISYGGALLRPRRAIFQMGETVDLNMYLPLFPQPIDVKARVVRIERASEKKTRVAGAKDVGVEYLDMTRSDREKLIETINMLRKTRQEAKP